MPDLDWLAKTLQFIWSLGEFLFVTIILKYIVVRWLADIIRKGFERFFVRSRREVAIWLHYRNKALRKGHVADTPIDCKEGECWII